MARVSLKTVVLCIATLCSILVGTLVLQLMFFGEPRTMSHDSTHHLLQTLMSCVPPALKLTIIEPTILWSLISSTDRHLLRNKGFNYTAFMGVKNVVSLAIFAKDLGLLEKDETRSKLALTGFKCSTEKSEVEFSTKGTRTKEEIVSHIFCSRDSIYFHIVVFYERNHYLWHGKVIGIHNLRQAENYETLLFWNADGSFDRFSIQKTKQEGLYIPQNIPKFLLQVSTSHFLSCLGITNITNASSTDTRRNNDEVPLEVFIMTAESAIKYMRHMTEASLTSFWLSSGTLLGWYRECGIISYTSDVDFSARAEDITEELILKFKTSSALEAFTMMGKVEEDLEIAMFFKWLRVDLFFTYDDPASGTWYTGGHRVDEGYSFRYIFPRFDLCSGDLLGFRVLVPCNPEVILEAEYGKNWRNPIEDWNFESSARNIKGRRYWSDIEIERYQNQFQND